MIEFKQERPWLHAMYRTMDDKKPLLIGSINHGGSGGTEWSAEICMEGLTALDLSDIAIKVNELNGHTPKWKLDEEVQRLCAKIDKLQAEKGVLTMTEAGQYVGKSKKTIQNWIAKYKTDHGRLPPWVCDAAGEAPRMVNRHEFETWLKKTKRRRGRPSKRL